MRSSHLFELEDRILLTVAETKNKTENINDFNILML